MEQWFVISMCFWWLVDAKLVRSVEVNNQEVKIVV
jgi:hypothetical protein